MFRNFLSFLFMGCKFSFSFRSSSFNHPISIFPSNNWRLYHSLASQSFQFWSAPACGRQGFQIGKNLKPGLTGPAPHSSNERSWPAVPNPDNSNNGNVAFFVPLDEAASGELIRGKNKDFNTPIIKGFLLSLVFFLQKREYFLRESMERGWQILPQPLTFSHTQRERRASGNKQRAKS
jgi:hypothetical protein